MIKKNFNYIIEQCESTKDQTIKMLRKLRIFLHRKYADRL